MARAWRPRSRPGCITPSIEPVRIARRTRAADGRTASRSGPMRPLTPASASAWHIPHVCANVSRGRAGASGAGASRAGAGAGAGAAATGTGAASSASARCWRTTPASPPRATTATRRRAGRARRILLRSADGGRALGAAPVARRRSPQARRRHASRSPQLCRRDPPDAATLRAVARRSVATTPPGAATRRAEARKAVAATPPGAATLRAGARKSVDQPGITRRTRLRALPRRPPALARRTVTA